MYGGPLVQLYLTFVNLTQFHNIQFHSNIVWQYHGKCIKPLMLFLQNKYTDLYTELLSNRAYVYQSLGPALIFNLPCQWYWSDVALWKGQITDQWKLVLSKASGLIYSMSHTLGRPWRVAYSISMISRQQANCSMHIYLLFFDPLLCCMFLSQAEMKYLLFH